MTRHVMRLVVAAVIAAAAHAPGAPARAQDTGAAEALFSRGVADLRAGRYDVACPALRESYRLDPELGPLFVLAECEEKRGKLATAAALYKDFLSRVERLSPEARKYQAARVDEATARRDKLVSEVPLLTLRLTARAPTGTVVARDGVALGPASLGIPLPLDPGDHVITAEAPDRPRTEQRLTLLPGERRVIELDPAPPPPPPRPARIAAFALGGLGLGGIAVGGVTGALTLVQRPVILKECTPTSPGVEVCSHSGKVAADKGKRLALASTIGVVVGTGALASATLLFVVDALRRRPVGPAGAAGVSLVALDVHHPSLGLKGEW